MTSSRLLGTILETYKNVCVGHETTNYLLSLVCSIFTFLSTPPRERIRAAAGGGPRNYKLFAQFGLQYIYFFIHATTRKDSRGSRGKDTCGTIAIRSPIYCW